MNLRVELWTPGQPLGNLSAERVAEIKADIDGPIVAIIDENGGVNVIQTIDPQTGEAWKSGEEALAFGIRYITPVAPEETE